MLHTYDGEAMRLSPASQGRLPPNTHPQQPILRLLVPLGSLKNPSQAISYVIRRRAEGRQVVAYLLHIEDAASAWPDEHEAGRRKQAKQAHSDVFSNAVRMLEGLDIGYATLIRPGPVVFSILDAAEELECDEIVVPAPSRGLSRWLSPGIVKDLLAQQRSVQVALAAEHGLSTTATK